MVRRSVIVALLVSAVVLASVAASPLVASPAPPAKATASEARPIDINAADGAALETVPGIGKSLSQRILAFREKNGPFQTVDDLLKVQGIGEKSIQKLRPYLTVTKGR